MKRFLSSLIVFTFLVTGLSQGIASVKSVSLMPKCCAHMKCHQDTPCCQTKPSKNTSSPETALPSPLTQFHIEAPLYSVTAQVTLPPVFFLQKILTSRGPPEIKLFQTKSAFLI